jgi:hypothetical protein
MADIKALELAAKRLEADASLCDRIANDILQSARRARQCHVTGPNTKTL